MRARNSFWGPVLLFGVFPVAAEATNPTDQPECPPGIDRCRDPIGCVDLSMDPENCGGCGHACDDGSECMDGICIAENELLVSDPDVANAPKVSLATVNQDVQVLPTGTNACFNNGEPYGVATDSSSLFVGYQRLGASSVGTANWASAYNSWQTSNTIPPVPAGWTVVGDPWMTYGTYSGLVYLGYILNRTSDGKRCAAAVATTPANFKAGTFTYGFYCASAGNYVDGPAWFYDSNSSDLYLAYTATTDGNVLHLAGMTSCGAGQPGNPGGGCPLTSSWTLGNPRIITTQNLTHATVAVNECASPNQAIVAYRTDSWDVRLAFVKESDGTIVKDWLLNSGQRFDQSSACAGCGAGTNGQVPKCGGCNTDCAAGSDKCWSLAPKAHIDTKYHAGQGKCYALVSYDFSAAASDGNTYIKSRMDVVDVTNVSATQNPVLAKSWLSASTSSKWNDFSGVSSTTRTTSCTTGGWFFYRQNNNNPCTTAMRGAVDGNLALTSIQGSLTLSGTFPTVLFGGTNGLGHYIGHLQRGLFDGSCGVFPFFTKAEPYTGGGTCRSCQGSEYTVNLRGARVQP